MRVRLPPSAALCQIGVFAKYWEAGSVKTRLAASIGPAAASRLQRAMLEATLNRLGRLACRRILAVSPAERLERFRRMARSRWQIEPQADGHLGERMECYFRKALAAGCQRVVLVGADTPDLPLEHVHAALDALAGHPLVLGPARDGGYYLVGVAGEVPPIFASIDWGTPSVWRQTIERLDSIDYRYALVPNWYDVDLLADVLALNERLRADNRDCPHLKRLRRVVERICRA